MIVHSFVWMFTERTFRGKVFPDSSKMIVQANVTCLQPKDSALFASLEFVDWVIRFWRTHVFKTRVRVWEAFVYV